VKLVWALVACWVQPRRVLQEQQVLLFLVLQMLQVQRHPVLQGPLALRRMLPVQRHPGWLVRRVPLYQVRRILPGQPSLA
jgi:hypothetical protein